MSSASGRMPSASRSWSLIEIGERARLRQHEIGDPALARDDLFDPLVDGARDRSAGDR